MAEAPQKKARTVRPVNPFVAVEQQLRLSTQAQLEEVVNETESLDALTSAVQTVVENMPPCKVRGESLQLLSAWYQRRRDLTAAGNTVMKPISKEEVVRSVFKQLQATNPSIKLDAQRPPSPRTCLSIAAIPNLSASDADMFRNMHAYLQDYCPSLLASAQESKASVSNNITDTVMGLRTVPLKAVGDAPPQPQPPTQHTGHTHPATSSSSASSSSSTEVATAQSKAVKRNLNPVFRSAQRDEAVCRRIEEFGAEVLKQITAMLPLQASFRRPLKPDESPDGLVVSVSLSESSLSIEFAFCYHTTKEMCTFAQFREKAMTRTPPVVSRDHNIFSDQPTMLYVRKSPSDPWRRLQALFPTTVTHFLDDMALRQFVARSPQSLETESAQ